MPADPPRDQNGKIVPHDHAEILNDHHVIRHTTPHDLCDDETGTKKRLSSGAFSESSDGGMSVDIEEWMLADGLDQLQYVTELGHGAVRLRVGDLRATALLVGWDPDGGHPYHGAVWGIRTPKKRKRILGLSVTLKKAGGEG